MQIEVTGLKNIDGDFWAYRTTFKSPIGISPYQLLFSKVCHLLVKLEHKKLWVLKKLNMCMKDATNMSLDQSKNIDKFWLQAYELADRYKDRIK